MFTLFKKITMLLTATVFMAMVVYAPFQAAKQNTEVAFAGGGGGFYTSVQGAVAFVEQAATAVGSTLTAAATKLTAFNTGSLWFKENVLDPIAWTVGKTLLSHFTQSIVNWINSGFQGSPAFVTDLEGFLLDVADVAAGEYINDKLGLGFLCDPFELNIKVALSVQYSTTRDFEPPECTLTQIVGNVENFLAGDFQEGGWQGWLDMTQKPGANTEYGSFLYAGLEMDAFIAEQKRVQEAIVDFGNGFLSQTICFPVAGKTTEDCIISNPGKVLETQLNEALGLGQDSLVVADEFNEIIGALFNQLAQQAITGVNGLLGMSSGTGYTDYSFAGSNGTTAFADAVATENQGNPTSGEEIQLSIGRVNDWVTYHQFVVATINNLEAQNNTNAARTDLIPGCYNLNVPSSLLNKRISSQAEITKANQNTLPALFALQVRHNNVGVDATASLQDSDPTNNVTIADLQKVIFDELLALQLSGDVPTAMDIEQARIQDRQQFQGTVNNFQQAMSNEVNNCLSSNNSFSNDGDDNDGGD